MNSQHFRSKWKALIFRQILRHLTKAFLKVLNKYASVKTKDATGNRALFVNKEMRKPICTRSELRNNFWDNPPLQNKRFYKNQKNKFVSLRKKCIKAYGLLTMVLINIKPFGNLSNPF